MQKRGRPCHFYAVAIIAAFAPHCLGTGEVRNGQPIQAKTETEPATAESFATSWSRGSLIPSYALDVAPPSDLRLNRFAPRSDEDSAPILPSLFMPGFPKSGTTWLYRCIMHTWTPSA
eukprot:6214320-Pleurochrysis_carterae.AAC.1